MSFVNMRKIGLQAIVVLLLASVSFGLGSTPRGSSYMLTDHWGGSWTDAEKTLSNTNDTLMCWAAASSNVLEWTGWGQVGGMTNSDEMFGYFQDHWTNEGGAAGYGWDWWFDGTNDSGTWGSQVDVPGGGFYPTRAFGKYYQQRTSDFNAMDNTSNFLREGSGIVLDVLWTTGGYAHSITCWGYSYNPNNSDEYYGLWITDSDDDKDTDTPGDTLTYYDVELSGSKWYLQDFYNSGPVYLDNVHALALNPIPEPATMSLLALGGLAMLRQRRKARPLR